MKNNYFIIGLLLIITVTYSCINDHINCTEEFRMIGIIITGDSLSDFYTIRVLNSETIPFNPGIGFPYDNWYPVLDDGFQNVIANSQEAFRFIGVISDSIVVDEDFIISADDCHISKVSGKDSVNIQMGE